MAERQVLRLTFGSGLDRATGETAADPTNFTDLRNIDLRRGKAMARKGLSRVATLSLASVSGGAISHVQGIHPLRSSRQGAIVVYEGGTRTYWLVVCGADASAPTVVATPLMTLPGAPASNLLHMCEVNKKLFVAHDEAGLTNRGVTAYYDNAAGTTGFLTANLDGAGAAFVKFRGVCHHLGYLFGWGYGSASQADRPEVVRVSLPGQPTVFNAEHYFLAGAGGDPVLRCISLRKELIVMKETELYAIFGYDRATFGIEPRDTEYGLASSRLAVTVNGVLYFWSSEGPRMTEGGPSVDIGRPLDIGGPEPAGLADDGEVATGFAVWNAIKRQVRFHFSRRVYVLHLEDPDNPRWSYSESTKTLRSGGSFYGAGALTQTQLQLYYGESSGAGVFKSDTGFQDDGSNYGIVAKTVPVAPAGAEGDCLFPTLWVTLVHTMAITLRVTPIVDGVAYPTTDLVLAAKGSRTLETFEVAHWYDTGDVRAAPRGAFYSAKIESLGVLAAGDLILDELALEYEVLREARKPS